MTMRKKGGYGDVCLLRDVVINGRQGLFPAGIIEVFSTNHTNADNKPAELFGYCGRLMSQLPAGTVACILGALVMYSATAIVSVRVDAFIAQPDVQVENTHLQPANACRIGRVQLFESGQEDCRPVEALARAIQAMVHNAEALGYHGTPLAPCRGFPWWRGTSRLFTRCSLLRSGLVLPNGPRERPYTTSSSFRTAMCMLAATSG
eukprot:m.100472 g.100472  ORF g.100472 m.100472 type:complete len:205 (+) comp8756_c0_seq2:466-1080(+)